MDYNDIMRNYCQLTLKVKNHTKVNGYYSYIQNNNRCNSNIKAVVLAHGNNLPQNITLSELFDIADIEQIEIDGNIIY